MLYMSVLHRLDRAYVCIGLGVCVTVVVIEFAFSTEEFETMDGYLQTIQTTGRQAYFLTFRPTALKRLTATQKMKFHNQDLMNVR